MSESLGCLQRVYLVLLRGNLYKMINQVDNVFIFGAGFSYDAGIPLLGNFMDVMIDIAYRKKVNGQAISKEDQKILDDALFIWDELDSYHGRVRFSDRNIEDILSILSYCSIGDVEESNRRLEVFNRAICTTISLTSNINYRIDGRISDSDSYQGYDTFWMSLFERYRQTKVLPSIISFNYDLVLEKALFGTLEGTNYTAQSLPFNMLEVNYQLSKFKPKNFVVEPCTYSRSDGSFSKEEGTRITYPTPIFKADISIELLKLHGSLNFPNPSDQLTNADSRINDLCLPARNPLIVPPIGNKSFFEEIQNSWRVALDRLSTAKNIIVVGYSLPKTDLNLQYFLKAAIGRNKGLNRIIVFNPELWESEGDNEMKERYRACFSDEVMDRIVFNPASHCSEGTYRDPPDPNFIKSGTTKHFIHTLLKDPKSILY